MVDIYLFIIQNIAQNSCNPLQNFPFISQYLLYCKLNELIQQFLIQKDKSSDVFNEESKNELKGPDVIRKNKSLNVFNVESENEQDACYEESKNERDGSLFVLENKNQEDFFDRIIKLAKVKFVINLFIYNYHK